MLASLVRGYPKLGDTQNAVTPPSLAPGVEEKRTLVMIFQELRIAKYPIKSLIKRAKKPLPSLWGSFLFAKEFLILSRFPVHT